MQGEFKLGDLVRLSGIREETNGLIAIREVTATKMGQGDAISPIEVPTGNVGEITEGLLIHTSGIIDSLFDDEPYGYKVFIDDGSGQLNIFVNTSTGLLSDTANWQLSDSLSVTGFSAEYNTDYENCPRIASDIQVFPAN